MFNFFKDDTIKKQIEMQDNETQERLIEALLLVTYADGKIKISETESLEKILDSVNWHEAFQYKGRFGEIMANIRAALESEAKITGLVNGIVNLDKEKNAFIIKCCEKLASADGSVDATEKSIVERFRKS